MDLDPVGPATVSSPRWLRTATTLALAVGVGAAVALVGALVVTTALGGSQRAYAAAQASVDLGTAGSFSVLGGQTVTNTGPSVLGADLGVSPGTAITGFPPGTVLGTTHDDDAVA